MLCGVGIGSVFCDEFVTKKTALVVVCDMVWLSFEILVGCDKCQAVLICEKEYMNYIVFDIINMLRTYADGLPKNGDKGDGFLSCR